jgi:hypothetical protein
MSDRSVIVVVAVTKHQRSRWFGWQNVGSDGWSSRKKKATNKEIVKTK